MRVQLYIIKLKKYVIVIRKCLNIMCTAGLVWGHLFHKTQTTLAKGTGFVWHASSLVPPYIPISPSFFSYQTPKIQQHLL